MEKKKETCCAENPLQQKEEEKRNKVEDNYNKLSSRIEEILWLYEDPYDKKGDTIENLSAPNKAMLRSILRLIAEIYTDIK